MALPPIQRVFGFSGSCVEWLLVAGFPGFEVSAAIVVLALAVAAVIIRVTRQDLAGAQP